MVILIEEDN